MVALEGAIAAGVTNLAQMAQFWRGLPHEWVIAGHSLFCASLLPELKDHFLIHYLVGPGDLRLPGVTGCVVRAPAVVVVGVAGSGARPSSLTAAALNPGPLQATFLWGYGGGTLTSMLLMVGC